MAAMKVFGLTGGIGSGKSTVARMLKELGAEVVDADEIAREVVRPGTTGLARLVEAFGAEILSPDGTLDRKRLGARVFADAAARARLNAITHPLIGEETARRMQALAAGGAPFAFYEAALLVDNGAHLGLDGLVVVEASPALQRARVIARDQIDDGEAARRVAAQVDNAARRAVADVVLVNDGTEETLLSAVKKLYDRLRNTGGLAEG
jgi:dephospho-CoA kinase